MLTINDIYNNYKDTPSDINEHLETLCKIASQCETVVEFWTRTAVSTYALLNWCDNVKSYDIVRQPEIDEVEFLAQKEGKSFEFILWDTRDIEIEETDFLFIDTLHCYEQLKAELERHGDKAKKFIAFHDTISFWFRDEKLEWYVQSPVEWLMQAINEFFRDKEERSLYWMYNNNNWLLIMKRE